MRVLTEVLERLRQGDQCVRMSGLHGSSDAFLIAKLAESLPESTPLLVVTTAEEGAESFARDVRFYLGGSDDLGYRAEQLQVSEASPYSEVAPDYGPTGSRLAQLFRVAHGLGPQVLVASVASLRRRVLAREVFESRCQHVATDEGLDRDDFVERLIDAGYERLPVVEDPGSFAVRGSLVDVYVPLYRYPLRLEWDVDRVESIRLFDPATQRTLRRLDDMFTHPARETVRSGKRLRELILTAADEAAAASSKARELIERLERGQSFLGGDGYLPALHGQMVEVLDYIPKGALLVLHDRAALVEAGNAEESQERDTFEARREEGAIVLEPGEHFVGVETLMGRLSGRRRLELCPLTQKGSLEAEARGLDDLAAELRACRASGDPLGPLIERIERWRTDGLEVVLQVSSAAQEERLRGLIIARDVAPPQTWLGALGHGFIAGTQVFVAEQEIFGPRVRRRAQAKRMRKTGLADLKPTDLIVHAEHGTGRYHGLVSLDVGGVRGDFLHLEYSGGKLYLPIYRLALVERYRGAEGDVKLDKLGGETFTRRKKKAAADAQALAEELLQIYAQRRALPGYAHAAPDEMFAEFEATFPFEETTDQERAISHVLADLQAARPMDRLVCGDVGFGKTEVALRAAFLAAVGGRQVAVLAPTTILVEQHLQTFRERVVAWPLRVEGLSRFRSRKQQGAILQDVAAGKVDVVIGTHRILQPDVRFKNLGLIVIDEEHRFGVAHKERLKKMRTEIDVLAMTATPIPRTLHLSLAGIRDLSLISTPPEDRLSVRTVLCRTEDGTIREAIRKEMARGGQVFFVHNRVQSIGEWVERVKALVPEARVGVGHGQMTPAALEQVMLQFIAGEIDVLVATAIIESGLDIPRVNTMLLHRADTFGLAQLYQLRGRIGRGRKRAFCYLLIDNEVLAGDAKQRLEAVMRYGELGSGFSLAAADLDIRGAGELLGGKQTGHIAALGFETYARILEEAVADLRGEPIQRQTDPEVTADVPSYIPEQYVEDAGQRLDLYKRLAQASDDDEVRLVMEEMRDRYGPEPVEAQALAALMRCKAAARKLGALALEIARNRLTITLGDRTPLEASAVARLVSKKKAVWRLTPDGRMRRDLAGEGSLVMAAAQLALRDLAALDAGKS